MASPQTDHFVMMAAYNRWANERLYASAANHSDEQLGEDGGAFFRSVLGVLNAIVVTDDLWLLRLSGTSPLGLRLDEARHQSLGPLKGERSRRDQDLIDRVASYSEGGLGQVLSYQNTTGAPQAEPVAQVLSHLFNHRTHHRGQAHDLIGQLLGAQNAPMLGLLAFLRLRKMNHAAV